MKHTLKQLVPKSLKQMIRTYQGKGLERSVHLRESTRYTDIGEAGPLIIDVFSRINDIPGWFNVDDCGHFFLVLSYQSAMGVKGDLLEIGSYHGRSTVLMAKCLQLHLNKEEKFRFIHIDGGHSAEQAYFDLNLCSKHLAPHGIIVMDDYYNKLWPGVTQGTDKFLNDSDTLSVLADLNRHGALGRKLYLIKNI